MSDGGGPAPSATGLRPGSPAPVRRRHTLRNLAIVVVAAVLFAVLVRTFVVQTYTIPSSSMAPTLKVGDWIAVDKLSYTLGSVHRGDIIVFKRPPRETADMVPTLVKRVIGLPGETISASGGHVEINGEVLAEPWLPPDDPTASFGPVTVPAGEYFVMGDNRGGSYDSRAWGPVPADLIVGKVVLRVWPPSQIRWF